MAAPSYTVDLTLISNMDTTTGVSALGGGGAGLGAGADFAIQNGLCVDKQITNATKGLVYNNGSTITNTTGVHFFLWVFAATPGLLDTYTNGGKRIIIGTSTTAYNAFYVEGSDTRPEGGNKCYAVRYNNTANGTDPKRVLTGSPGANPQYFGGILSTTASVKGVNLGVDVIRYGTGAYITAGDSGDPATFAGFSTINDADANRYGISQAIPGGYDLQGSYVIGQNSSGTPTLAYFEDSNTQLTLTDTIHSATDFTKIIIDHASTVFNLTNVTIKAIGTNNPGQLIYNNASTTSALIGCGFNDIGISTLRAGVTATACSWRNAALITTNGATLDSCNIENSVDSASISSADLEEMTDCEFGSDGSNHAVELTSIGSGTMNWNNYLTGYVTGASGSPASTSSTGNESIYVNVGSGTLTINVGAGYTIPSIRTAGATVNVVAGQVTTTITVTDISTGLPISGASVSLWADAGGPLTEDDSIIYGSTNGSGVITDTRGLASNQPVLGWVRKASSSPFYQESQMVGIIDNSTGLNITVQMISDE